MTDWLRTAVDGDRFITRLDLAAVARLAPGRVSGPHRVPESGAIGGAIGTRPDDTDITPELVDLIESAAPRCEVMETKLDEYNHVQSRLQCPHLATWVIRTVCVCREVGIDLICDEHYACLFNSMLYVCPSCHKRDEVILRTPTRL